MKNLSEFKNKVLGRMSCGTLRIAANVADAETVTIGPYVFEFDRAANGVTAGNIAVTGHADDTPTAAGAKLAIAIGAQGLVCTIVSVNEYFVCDPAGRALATTETLGGSGNAWDAATLNGGVDSNLARQSAIVQRVPVTAEVTAGTMRFAFPFNPAAAIVNVRTTSSGVVIAWDGATTITGSRVDVNNAGSVDWATTSTVTVIAGR